MRYLKYTAFLFFLACLWGFFDLEVNCVDAIQTIAGEASNQPFRGQVAVGEVIRNRGSVKGFYGKNSKHLQAEGLKTWFKATLAWNLSAWTNYTRGATLFENVFQNGFPNSWDRSKVFCVAQIYDHWFFREIK